VSEVPACVRAIAAGSPTTIVWMNELATTYEIAGPTHCFVKWAPAGSRLDLDRERARISWAISYASVPEVLGHGRDSQGSWLVTRALPGDNAIAERWKADPATAVAAIGAGLRAFHDALPVAACPFGWSVDERLADIRRRAALGTIRPERWYLDHQHLDLGRVFALLAEPPEIEQLVVCHGDTCAPNTIVGDDGRCVGHVDLGALGVADRWADLAIATWSTKWNYGPGWEEAVLEAYGVAPDPDRTRYYRLIWDLGP
jgi:kanamycin kinase